MSLLYKRHSAEPYGKNYNFITKKSPFKMNVMELITPLKAKILQKLNPHALTNLCLVSKNSHAEFCENRKAWEYLLWTEFNKVPKLGLSLSQYYYYNKSSAIALGPNSDSQLGGTQEVQQWKTIMVGVRNVVMREFTTALITVDDDLYLSGDARFHVDSLKQPTLIMSGVKQVYLDTFDDFMYILKTNSDLFLYKAQESTFLISGIVRIDEETGIFYGSDTIYWHTDRANESYNPYTLKVPNIKMNTERINENVRKVTVKINGETQVSAKYLSYSYLVTTNGDLYELKTGSLIANEVRTFGTYEMIEEQDHYKYIYWIDKDYSLRYKSVNSRFTGKIKLKNPIIAFRPTFGQTYYLLTADSKLYIGGSANAILQNYINGQLSLPPDSSEGVPLESVDNFVLLMENVISFDVATDNIICIVYPN